MAKPLLAYLSGILLLCSCNAVFDEEALEKEPLVPIHFSVSESFLTARGAVSAIDGTNVSSVGLYGVQESSTSGQFPWSASPFASNLVPSGISQGVLSFSPKLYYPTGGRRVSFYAYYPRTTNTATTANSYITPPDNGTAPVYHFTLTDQQDVMHVASAPSGSYSGTNVSLLYQHKLCQIIINTNILTGTLRNMKLLAVPVKGAMNIETGAISWGSQTADLTVNVPVLGGMSDPILVPANVSSYQLQVSLLILTTTYQLTPSNGVFSPGVTYTITLR